MTNACWGCSSKRGWKAAASMAIKVVDHHGPLTIEVMTNWARRDSHGSDDPNTWARRLKHLRASMCRKRLAPLCRKVTLRRYRVTLDMAGESNAPEAAFFIGTRGQRHGLQLGDLLGWAARATLI